MKQPEDEFPDLDERPHTLEKTPFNKIRKEAIGRAYEDRLRSFFSSPNPEIHNQKIPKLAKDLNRILKKKLTP